MELTNTVVPLAALAVLLLAGLPIGFALLLTGFVGLAMITSLDAAVTYLGLHAFSSIARFVFTPIPLFVLMGDILAVSGVGADMFDAALKWFGRVRGGLAVASIVACAIFASMCGLSMAGAATIGVVAIPEMLKRGYDKGLATGSVATAGTLGILIPPSLPFIMYGVIAEQSVGQLFIAGIIPGTLLTVLFSTYVLIIAWRRPHLAPGIAGVTWKERFLSLRKLWSAIVLIILVLGSIYGGVATPTEAAGVGAIGALGVALVYRSLSFKKLVEIARRTVELVGFIMILVVGAMLFSYYLTLTGATQSLSKWMASLAVAPWVIIAGMNIILLILGCFLDSTAIILITTPLFLPIITSLGFDPIWYGVILIINLEIAFITPPVGMNLYVTSNIAPDVPLGTILRGAVPFLLLALLAITLVAVFPRLALWLPSTMR
ncbi:MAG: TRAP transporter large permease [Deltaproteobacteria bacterium]|nr:TRAP transporter large permease [Deltaproteobacteria bacterium]